jgi:hypothetical protein
MIENTTVNGKPATVAYILRDFTPASKEDAELAEVHFEDGTVVFLVMKSLKQASENGPSASNTQRR